MKIIHSEYSERVNKIGKSPIIDRNNSMKNDLKDEVYISESAKSFEKAMEKARLSDVDKTAYVNKLSIDNKNNAYKVDSEKIAQKLLDLSNGFDRKA